MKISEAELVRLAQLLARVAARKSRGRRTPEEMLGEAYVVALRRASRWKPGGLSLERYVLLYAGRIAWSARAEDSDDEPSIHYSREIAAGKQARRNYLALDSVCRSQGDGMGRPWSDMVGSPDPNFRRVEASEELRKLIGSDDRIRAYINAMVWGDTQSDIARREGISRQRVGQHWTAWTLAMRRAYPEGSAKQRARPVETIKSVPPGKKRRRV